MPTSPARVSLSCLTLALGLGLAPARAQDDADLRERKQVALTKGVRWLFEQQQPDGTWTYDNRPLQLQAYPMTQGVTALCAFALLKCGVEPEDPRIEKAFAYLRAQPLQWTYAVSCVLLAVEARLNHEPPPDGPQASGTTERKPRKRKPSPADLELARRCVEFLGAHQQKGLWRYPSGSQEDVSNAQYALLALDAAERLAVPVPKEIYEKVALRLLEAQEQDGPAVQPFPVPAADRTFKELRAIEADLEKEIRKLERKFKRDPNQPDDSGQTLSDHRATVERGAARRITESAEKLQMKARGWAYFPPPVPENAQVWQKTTNGGMTASGVAALLICKSRLEGTPRWERELKPQVNQAIRDGAAWLAQNFALDKNPNNPLHHYYYLYGLERAGILGLIGRFGTHDWYQGGCELFLGAQKQDGSWNATPSSTSGPVPDTCFGLLFLARGTTPVINVPGRVMTGAGR